MSDKPDSQERRFVCPRCGGSRRQQRWVDATHAGLFVTREYLGYWYWDKPCPHCRGTGYVGWWGTLR